MKNKLLSVLLTICMVALLLPVSAIPAYAETIETTSETEEKPDAGAPVTLTGGGSGCDPDAVDDALGLPRNAASDWDALQALISAGGTVTLDRDYTAGEDDHYLTVPAGVTVTLDLNGHTVDYGESGDGMYNDDQNPDYYIGAIVVLEGGALTVCDSSTDGTGKITGITDAILRKTMVVYGSCTLQSGAVAGEIMVGDTSNHPTGSFTMSGGTMEDCSLTVNACTSFTMTGGSISGHDVEEVVFNYGTFTMSGGTITGTDVTSCVVQTYSRFTMTGGTVSGAGQAFGIRTGMPDNLHVSGNPVISSVYLLGISYVFIDGELTSGASIPVISGAKPTEYEPRVITWDLAKGGENAERYFTNLTDLTDMVKNDDGELELRRKVAHTEWDDLLALLSTSGTVTLDRDYTANSVDQELTIPQWADVVLDLNGHTVNGSALSGYRLFVLNPGSYHPDCDTTTLTIKDSATGGRILCGTNQAVRIDNDAVFYMTGGTIESGAAPIVETLGNSSRFYMTGGAITGTRTSPSDGSCVSLWSDNFFMSGGTISGTGYHNVISDGSSIVSTSILSGGTITGTDVTNVLNLAQNTNFIVSGGTIDGSGATNAVHVDPYLDLSSIRLTVSGSPTINGALALRGEMGSVSLIFAGTTNLEGVQFSEAGDITGKIKEGYTDYVIKRNGTDATNNGDGTFTIPVTTDAQTITAEMKTPLTHADLTFDNSAQTYTGAALAIPVRHLGRLLTEGTDYTVTYTKDEEPAELLNAGTYTATFTGMGDYTGGNSVEMTVDPAPVTLTANCGTVTYNGTEQTLTGFTCSVEGLTFAETVIASGSGTNTGTYDVTFSGVTLNETRDTTGNYVVTATEDGILNVDPAPVTLTANSDALTYNGMEQTLTGFTCSVEGLTFAGTVIASGSGTYAGEHVVTFSGVTLNETRDATGNYVVTATEDGILTIDRKPVTVTAKGQRVAVGSSIVPGPEQATLTGAVEGHTLAEVTLTETDGTITPAAAKIVDGEGGDTTANYAVSYETGAVTWLYAVTVDSVVGAAAEPDKTLAAAGETVNLTVATDEGYMENTLTYTTGSGDPVVIENHSFTMPAAPVTVTVSLRKDVRIFCTADVPDQTLGNYAYLFYKFEAANENPDVAAHIGAAVMDGEKVLTLGTDYEFGLVFFADGTDDLPGNIDDVCVVEINGIGAYYGTLLSPEFTIVAPVTSGDWGSNLHWELREGTIIITGAGGMTEADSFTDYPWFAVSDGASAVVIDAGVTSVAAQAFGGSNNVNPYAGVTSLSLPATLSTVGDDAFAYMTGIETVDLSNVTAIGVRAFNQCRSLTVTVPATVTALGDGAFDGCREVYYSVIVNDAVNGTVSADVTCAEESETVTLTVTPDPDYELKTLTVTDLSGADIAVTNNTFVMPASNVTVTAEFRAMFFTVTVNNGTGGGSYAPGDSVTVTANAPEANMRFKEWTGADGLTFTDGSAYTATATFTMPEADVTLTATYEDAQEPGNVYPIGSYEELKAFAALVNNGNTNRNARLTADIVAADGNWTPIREYYGIFDGCGYTITGLRISSEDNSYAGMFRLVEEGGVVQNLALKDVCIQAGSYAGSIAGRNKGVIQNCCVTGTVTGSNDSCYDGGIVGLNNGSILYCYSAATVSSVKAGGVIGVNNGTAQSCYYDSDVLTAVSAIAYDYSTSTNVSGLTTAQMTGTAAADNMTGFDFDNVWKTTESYPSLRTPEPIEPKFATHSLVLSGQIGVNFFMDLRPLSDADRVGTYMTFTISGKGSVSSEPVYFDESMMNSDALYHKFTCYVSAIQMADTITATYHWTEDDVEKTVSDTYSIKQYIEGFDAALAKDENAFDAKTVALVHALADYGHYVQIFLSSINNWEINTGTEPDNNKYAQMMENPYTGSYTVSTVRSAVEAYQLTAEEKKNGQAVTEVAVFKAPSMSLVLDSETAIRIFLAHADNTPLNLADVDIRMDTDKAVTWEPIQKGNRVMVEIRGVKAGWLTETFTITAEEGDNTQTINVSALSYVGKLLDSATYADNAAARNAVCALYAYAMAAKGFNN